MRIAGRDIGPGRPVYVIAEMSCNHAGSLDRALKLIHAAKQAGADAVKVQCFRPEDMALPGVLCPDGPWKGRELVDLYAEAITPRSWFPRLFAEAEKVGITLFSSVFSPGDVEFLETTVDCPAYKIASPEALDADLARAVMQTKKPILVSLGASPGDDVTEFLDLVCNGDAIVPMHCVSAYPAPAESMNLATIRAMRDYTDLVGLSDHSLGTLAATTAVALGACVVEKHLMLEPTAYPTDEEWPLDSAFSLEPNDFGHLVASIRETEAMLGTVRYGGTSVYARSLWVTKPIAKGEPFTRENVRSLRPAGGMPPSLLPSVLKLKARRDLEPGPLLDEDIDA